MEQTTNGPVPPAPGRLAAGSGPSDPLTRGKVDKS